MSSGFGHFAKSALGMAFRLASVSMMLGRIEFTRTPVPFTSAANESIIATAAAGLVLFIGRRKAAVLATPAGTAPAASAAPAGSSEELERLRRALAEIED